MATLIQTAAGSLADGQRNITLKYATAPTEGNLQVASVVWDDQAETAQLTPPPGWVLHGSFVYSGSRRIELWSKIADASPTTDFLWQLSTTGSGIVTGAEFDAVSDVASVVEATGSLDPPPLTGDVDLWVAAVGSVHFQSTLKEITFLDMTFGDSAMTTGGTKLQSSWAWASGPDLDTSVTGGNGLILVGFAPEVAAPPPPPPPVERYRVTGTIIFEGPVKVEAV